MRTISLRSACRVLGGLPVLAGALALTGCGADSSQTASAAGASATGALAAPALTAVAGVAMGSLQRTPTVPRKTGPLPVVAAVAPNAGSPAVASITAVSLTTEVSATTTPAVTVPPATTAPPAVVPAAPPHAPAQPVPQPVPVVPSQSLLSLSATTYSVAQNAGRVSVSVKRSGSAAAAVTVHYSTGSGTADAGVVYQPASGTLSWAANDTAEKSFFITLSQHQPFSGRKSFTVALSDPSTGAATGSPSGATVTVLGAAAGAVGTAGLSIKVVGNHFIDEGGSPVQLRGVNVSGLEFVAIDGWDAANPWGSQTGDPTPNWAAIKTWGANAVRLPLNEASWLGLQCVDLGGNAGKVGAVIKADPGGNYQATVEQSVAAATAAGLYVILDLHWGAPNVNGTPACPTAQNAMADADHSVDFWASVANHFKGNPAVIFELFNEPFLDAAPLIGNTPWPDLLNGGSLSKFAFAGGAGETNLTWSTAGMQQLLDAVRSTGATNVVLTSTLQWSQQMDGWLKYKPNDSAGQLGAVWHAYPSTQYVNQVACVADGIVTVSLPQCSSQEMAAVQGIIAAGYPVVATEFGDTIGGTTPPWASVLLPFADTSGVSYLAWTWNTWSGNANVLITDAAGNPTPGYGTYVKRHYLCRASGSTDCP